MFTPIQKIIPAAAVRLGIKRQIDAASICEKYRKLAPRLVHTNALHHTFPKFYRGKTLTIGVTDSAWAQVVSEKSAGLIRDINKELGTRCVNGLKTQVVEKLPENLS